MNEFIAYCGLDCEKCEARTPEMINCTGCRVPGVKFPFCESMCPIKICSSEKKYETCADCIEVASCEKAAMVLGNNMEARENLGISGSFS